MSMASRLNDWSQNDVLSDPPHHNEHMYDSNGNYGQTPGEPILEHVIRHHWAEMPTNTKIMFGLISLILLRLFLKD